MPHESLSNHASDLVEWTIERMANRTDACGGYYRKGGKTVPTTRKKIDLAELLKRHFAATGTDDVVGLHTTDPATNTSKFIAFDIDAHDDKADPNANLDAAMTISELLHEQYGVVPHVFDSNGKGGFHVFGFFDAAYPTDRVHLMGQQIAKAVAVDLEIFPKQPSISPDGFGNWIRVPGRHHTRDHWAKVWTGEGWNELTADYLLTIEGDTPDLPTGGGVPSLRIAEPDDTDAVEADADEIAVVIHKLKSPQWPPAIQGKKGDDSTYKTCCMVVRDHGLSVPQAIIAMKDWNKRCKPPWSESELREKLTHARAYGTAEIGEAAAERNFGNWGSNQGGPESVPEPSAEPQRVRPMVANTKPMAQVEGGKRVYEFVNVNAVTEAITKHLDGWPKCLGGKQIFVERPMQEGEIMPSIRYLTQVYQLFAWLHSVSEVHWQQSATVNAPDDETGERSCVTKKEFYEHLQQTLPSYAGIGGLPHVPPRDDLYYPTTNLPEPTGNAWKEFVSTFNAETDEDRTLMAAAFLTPLWGGEPGSRPAFIFASKYGRGVGKTTTAEVFAELYGGLITWNQREKPEDFKKRLLADESLSQRVCLHDNVKGRLDSAGLDAMITSRRIDGHRMYLGQFARPNLMTWYITANTPSLSRDIADRSYIIHIGPQQHGTDWRTWAFHFIKENRGALLADMIAILEYGAEVDIERPDRWAAWQRGVLACFTNANEVVDMTRERRDECDDDREQAELLDETIALELESRGHRPENQIIVIPNEELFEMAVRHGIIGHKYSKIGAMRRIREMVTDSPGPSCICPNPSRSDGRSWLWVGKNVEAGEERRALIPKVG